MFSKQQAVVMGSVAAAMAGQQLRDVVKKAREPAAEGQGQSEAWGTAGWAVVPWWRWKQGLREDCGAGCGAVEARA